METIVSIEEGNFNHEGQSFEGFLIVTSERTIKIGITDYQSCCENSGYFICQDDVSDFKGAVLNELKIVDTALNVEKIKEFNFYEVACMFVNFETSAGTLQFTAYNDHNGYYGHDAVVLTSDNSFSHAEVL